MADKTLIKFRVDLFELLIQYGLTTSEADNIIAYAEKIWMRPNPERTHGSNPGHSGNPGHHSRDLKQSAIAGAATGGVVYGVAKWKENWVRQNLHLAPEYMGIIAGAAGAGVSYFVL